MTTPDDIRDLAWRTIRDALHDQVRHSPCPRNGTCWTLRDCGHDAQVAVDALAEIGMLPTGTEWGAGEVEDHTTDRVRTVAHDVCENEADAGARAELNDEPVMQRYIHDWRVAE